MLQTHKIFICFQIQKVKCAKFSPRFCFLSSKILSSYIVDVIILEIFSNNVLEKGKHKKEEVKNVDKQLKK